MAHSGVKQDALGGGGFTGIDVRGDADVAITFDGEGSGHDASLVIRHVLRRAPLPAAAQQPKPIVRVNTNSLSLF
jgi:hypothetical protein